MNKNKLLQKIWHAVCWAGEHTLGHIVSYPLVAGVFLILAWAADEISGLKVAHYLSTHPARAAASLLALGLFITGLLRGLGYLRIYIRNREILASVGVSGFWAHSKSDEKITNWQACKEKILAGRPKDLRILGVTGWETFGKEGSPLHDIVDNFHGEIRILLIKPRCDAFTIRAKALGLKEKDYEKEIKNTIAYCEQLSAKGKSIIVKLYKQTPIWKMVFTENYMWLQHYKPDDHVDNTPVYTLFANEGETSLYFPLMDVFRKRWDYDDNETVVRPKVNLN